jgi:hypothetical protein
MKSTALWRAGAMKHRQLVSSAQGRSASDAALPSSGNARIVVFGFGALPLPSDAARFLGRQPQEPLPRS